VSRIYWDSMVFIYWLESHPAYAPRVEFILQSMLTRGDRLCASHLTLGEVLVGPLKHQQTTLAANVRKLFDGANIEVLPFDRQAAERFAQLRASANITPADAIHLACASASGIDLFLTHDASLQRLSVPGIHFIAGLDVNVF
jgi:predicted nucleic acid-binding protein